MSDLRGSTILVTGGSGLIGSHTVDRLVAEDVRKVIVFDKHIHQPNLARALASQKVDIVEGDIFDVDQMRAALRDVDFVFHFAGMLLLSASQNPRACLRDNINGMYNLLDVITERRIKKLVYASSVSIYGSSTEDAPMTEDHPLRNRTMYGASKIVGEQFCRVFQDTAGLDYLALRYSSVYGPRQHYEGLYPRLIMESLDRIERGLPPQIKGKGDEVQDFIYVGDVAEANLKALASGVTDEAINIANGKPTTVKELVGTLLSLTKPDLEIEFLPGEERVFVPFRKFSVEKARQLLAFQPVTDLEKGLEALIRWKRAKGPRRNNFAELAPRSG
jgi:UDP-glucose 4-epimerase